MSSPLGTLIVIVLTTLAACVTLEPEPIQPAPSGAVPTNDGNTAAAPVELQEVEVKEVTLSNNLSTPGEMICRRERVTGSHLPVRVCKTRAQREAEQRGAQEFMRGVGSVQGEGASEE